MKLNSNPIMIVLGIILIGIGAGSFLGYRFFPNNQTLIIAVFILAALILFVVLAGSVKENVSLIIAALWLILMGLMAQFKLDLGYNELILSILPLGAGAFMILGL